MSDKSQEILLGGLDESPEEDSDGLELEQRYTTTFYESSKRDILDHINHENFKYIWVILNRDILTQPIKDQAIFIEQALEKISEVYDFEFFEKLTFSDEYECGEFYEFLEFLEYNNLSLLEPVWKSLKIDLRKIDTKLFIEQNSIKIVLEIDKQIKLNKYNTLVSMFLKGFNKDGLMSWFLEQTKRNRIGLIINNII